jgi:hypothetical protein
MKRAFNQGVQPSLYFWRDQHGHEIDLIVDQGTRLIPVEIKSGSTFHEDWLKNLTWFSGLQTNSEPFLVYGGDKSFSHMKTSVLPWTELESIPYQ